MAGLRSSKPKRNRALEGLVHRVAKAGDRSRCQLCCGDEFLDIDASQLSEFQLAEDGFDVKSASLLVLGQAARFDLPLALDEREPTVQVGGDVFSSTGSIRALSQGVKLIDGFFLRFGVMA